MEERENEKSKWNINLKYKKVFKCKNDNRKGNKMVNHYI